MHREILMSVFKMEEWWPIKDMMYRSNGLILKWIFKTSGLELCLIHGWVFLWRSLLPVKCWIETDVTVVCRLVRLERRWVGEGRYGNCGSGKNFLRRKTGLSPSSREIPSLDMVKESRFETLFSVNERWSRVRTSTLSRSPTVYLNTDQYGRSNVYL